MIADLSVPQGTFRRAVVDGVMNRNLPDRPTEFIKLDIAASLKVIYVWK